LSVRLSLGLALLQRYFALAASLVTMMIVSRLITPAEMGVYFVAAGFLGMAGPLAQLGVGAYLVQERELNPARIGTASGLLLLSSWSIALLLFLSRHALADFYGEPALAAVLTVTAACFVLVPISTPAVSLLQREMRFDALLVIGVIGSAVQAVTAIVLALRGHSYMSLAWAALAQQVGIMLAVLMFRPLALIVRPRLSEWRRVLRVGGALTLSTFAAEIGNAAPLLVLGRAAGFEAAGFFARGRTVTDLIWRGLLEGILPVLLPTFAQISREGRDLRPAVILAFTHLGAVTWPFFALIGLLALPVLRVLFGPLWDESAPVVQILCLIGISLPITAVIPELLVASGRSQLEMKLQGALQFGRIALVVALAGHGMSAVAWALVFADLLYLVAALTVTRQLVGLRFRDLAKPALQNVAVTLGAVLGPLLLLQILGPDLPPVVLLGLAMPLAALGWILALYLSVHPLNKEITTLLIKIYKKLFL
jgi:O-antigen/teichoic acid export membrane protein